MDDLIVLYSDIFKKHVIDRAHPESPSRLDQIMEGIEELSNETDKRISIIPPEYIEDEDLLAVHVPNHIEKIKAISDSGGGMVTIDTTLNEHTFDVAKFAAGATKQAVQVVDENKAKISYAVVRPPGHHAETNSAGGFCFFNNIAVAAEWLVVKKGYNKVAIIDIDHHFGNGTSHIFYHRKDILYLSLHAHPMYSYPGTGYPNETGVVEGKGYNINVPLLPGSNNFDWLQSLIFSIDIIQQYQPEILLVSIGYDALEGDPVGMLNLTPNAFTGAGYLLHTLARDVCGGRIACTLEGGYKIDQLKEVSNKFLKGLFGFKPQIISKAEETPISDYTTSMLNQVKKEHRDYWRF